MNFQKDKISIRRLSILTILGFSSGLPLSLTSGTLQAWFTEAGIDIQTIGMLSLIGIPYVLKFLWAPLLDKYAITRLGRRRSWMLLSQCAIGASVLGMAMLAPAEQLSAMVCLALVIALFSATQDIAVDAYRAELLQPHERGLGVGLAVAAYRIALIFAGAGALFIADSFGFTNAYIVMATAILVGVVASLLGPKPYSPESDATLMASFWLPLRDFLGRKHWGVIIALIVFYKLGDAFAEKLTIPFLLRELGFTLTEVGAFYKTAGISAAILGGVTGGALMLRLSLYRALFLFAILQMLTNIGFVILAVIGKSYAGVMVVVIAENLFGGMGTAAFVALIMALCDARFTATQFALLTAIASLGRVFAGPAAGRLVESYSWVYFFTFTVAVGLISVILLILIRAQIMEIESDARKDA